MDDPLATTTVVDSLGEEMAGFAEEDAMAMLGEEGMDEFGAEGLGGDEFGADSVNQTAFLENNYPLAVNKGMPSSDAGFGAPLSGDMIASLMGGAGGPGGPSGPMFGQADPRKRGAMRGLGLR